MNKQQILEALEGLKELTNDNGKRTIDGIKAGVHFLQEEESQVPAWAKPMEGKAVFEPLPEVGIGAAPAPEVFHALSTVKKKKGGKK